MFQKTPILNVPNLVTVVRILMIPVFFVFASFSANWAYIVTALIFGLAALTDWLDGYLARRLDQASRLGAFLDPVADKLIVVVALLLLVHKYNSFWLTLPAVVITMREILISALREWMAEMGRRTSVAVSYLGKIKTTVQMISIIFLLVSPPYERNVFMVIGYITLYAAAVLTVWSMLMYLKAAWSSLMAGEALESPVEETKSGSQSRP